ncbi:hypothetical protein D3C72_2440610 [compost metagenome]
MKALRVDKGGGFVENLRDQRGVVHPRRRQLEAPRHDLAHEDQVVGDAEHALGALEDPFDLLVLLRG